MTDLLGALDLSLLRETAEELMPDSCVIWRRVRSTDNAGGRIGSLIPVGTSICRVVPQRVQPLEAQTGGRLAQQQQTYIYVVQGTDVQAHTDQVRVTGGGTFEVVGIHGPRSYEVSRRVIGVELR